MFLETSKHSLWECFYLSISAKQNKTVFLLLQYQWVFKNEFSFLSFCLLYLHDLQQSLCDCLQGCQSKSLPLIGARREWPVPVAGAEGDDSSWLDFANAKQQVKFR